MPGAASPLVSWHPVQVRVSARWTICNGVSVLPIRVNSAARRLLKSAPAGVVSPCENDEVSSKSGVDCTGV